VSPRSSDLGMRQSTSGPIASTDARGSCPARGFATGRSEVILDGNNIYGDEGSIPVQVVAAANRGWSSEADAAVSTTMSI